MQLVTKGLLRGHKLGIAATASVDGKDGRTGEAKEIVFFEALDDVRMHFTKLGAMAFIKNNHNLLLIDRVLGIFLDKGSQLLNGGDDDMSIVILQLLFELGGAGIAIGSALFKAVVFLHGLVVQILAVYDKEHLVNEGQLGRQPRRFKGGQGFAGARGMPNEATGGNTAVFFIIVGNLHSVQNALGSSDLVGTHDHEDVFRGKDAIAGDNIQQGMLGKKGLGEVD